MRSLQVARSAVAAAIVAGLAACGGAHPGSQPLPSVRGDPRRATRIAAVTGKDPAPLFRFPFGDADARTIAIANQVGYVPVRWTVDTLGWEGTAGHITAAVVASRVLAAARPGEIVLMHVGSNPDDHTTLDAEALPTVIRALRARGYSFATLNELTGRARSPKQSATCPRSPRCRAS